MFCQTGYIMRRDSTSRIHPANYEIFQQFEHAAWEICPLYSARFHASWLRISVFLSIGDGSRAQVCQFFSVSSVSSLFAWALIGMTKKLSLRLFLATASLAFLFDYCSTCSTVDK